MTHRPLGRQEYSRVEWDYSNSLDWNSGKGISCRAFHSNHGKPELGMINLCGFIGRESRICLWPVEITAIPQETGKARIVLKGPGQWNKLVIYESLECSHFSAQDNKDRTIYTQACPVDVERTDIGTQRKGYTVKSVELKNRSRWYPFHHNSNIT